MTAQPLAYVFTVDEHHEDFEKFMSYLRNDFGAPFSVLPSDGAVTYRQYIDGFEADDLEFFLDDWKAAGIVLEHWPE